MPGQTISVRITAIDSSRRDHHRGRGRTCRFIDEHQPDWSVVQWINVDGLGDLRVIHALAKKYHLHPRHRGRARRPQRPKVHVRGGRHGFQARLFIMVRELSLREKALARSR